MQRIKSKLKTLARLHDEMPAMRAVHIVAIVLAAALLNLGAFAFLIVVHMGLDFLKHRELHGFGWRKAIHATWRDNVVDTALLLVSLTVALYFHHAGGVVAVSGLIRADVFIVQALAIFVPKAEILCRSVDVMRNVSTRVAKSAPVQWAFSHKVARVALAVCVFLLLIAPIALKFRSESLAAFVSKELVPWHF